MEIVVSAIGWIAWWCVVYLAVIFMLGCRRFAKAGQSFTFLTATRTMYLWIILLLFLPMPGIYKLHILWIVPLVFLGLFSYYMQSTLPIIFFTCIFMRIILLGIHTPLGKDKIVLDPPLDTFEISPIAVLKADWDVILSYLKSKSFRPKSVKDTEKDRPSNHPETTIFRNIELIKGLLKKRVKNHAITSLGNIDTISDPIFLMGLPESTIVAIIEAYLQGKKRGLSDKENIEAIENYRASFGDETGILPSELTLLNYIKYRVKLEHSHSDEISITDDFIWEATEEATKVLSQRK